jgi:hypothetical protein
MRLSGTRGRDIDRSVSVGAMDDGVNTMATLSCPRCRGTAVQRATRHGTLERALSALYIYPFRCRNCLRRFRRLVWGVRYRAGLRSERRVYERLRIRGQAYLQWAGGQAVGTMRNVSVAGAAIETEAAIPTGTSLTLVLRPASHIEAITIGEAIARSVRAGRLGVQFRHVEERERARLQRLVYRPPRVRRRHRV